MTDQRGWGLSEQHLMPDAVVAFVDGELSPAACDRAAAHVARCPYCAAEVSAQRQARAAVRSADTPAVPAALLASLRAIPQEVELSGSPDGLAISQDGQLVAVQRPDHLGSGAPLGTSAPLGSSVKLGDGLVVVGRRVGRRTVQGAGIVVSGLVLGALALVNSGGGVAPDNGDEPPADGHPALTGGGDVRPAGVVVQQVAADLSPLPPR
jgi:anti-sigma factor RsiW